MAFDFNRIRLGERIAGACALLLFIDLFLNWYSVGPIGISGWRSFSFTDLLLLLLILVTLGLVFLAATQRTPALPIAGSIIVAAFGLLMALIVLYRIINQPGPNSVVSADYGAYLGFLLVLGIAAGGYMAMRDEGTTVAGAREQAGSLMNQRGTRVTPPAAGADPAAEPTSAPTSTSTTPGAVREEPPSADPPGTTV